MNFNNIDEIQAYLNKKTNLGPTLSEEIAGLISNKSESSLILENNNLNVSEFSNIKTESIDAVFSFNTEEKSADLFHEYLIKTSAILKDGKPIILCLSSDFLVLVKNSNAKRDLKFNIKFYSDNKIFDAFFDFIGFVKPINNLDYLENLINKGYSIRKIIDPKNDPEKHLKTFKKFIERGKEFAPENWLEEMGYQFVEPSTFTLGHRIAYKMINDFPDERFNSNFSLIKGEMEYTLYLQKELPKL
ncbi:hypothetical protein ACFLTI_04660 [Bacteroidota bacterium]